MQLGFIGTGAITRAIVTGLLRFDFPVERIALSPRNAQIAAELAALDSRVHVCASNEEVLARCDVVCLAVVPQIAADVLGALKFEPRHHVISLIAGVSLDRLATMLGPVKGIVRAVPLPAVAQGKGSTAICPADAIAKSIFAALGEAVEVNDEHRFSALCAVTATMASYYSLLHSQAEWLVRQGIAYEDARAYLSGFSVGLAHETTLDARSFSTIAADCTTPGGLNAQVNTELSDRSTYAHYDDALDRILKRIEG